MRSSLRSLNQGGALHGACLAGGDGDGASCPDNAPLWRSWVVRTGAMPNFAITGFYEVRLLHTHLLTLRVHTLPSAVLYIHQCLVRRITQRTYPTYVVLLLGEARLERRPLPSLKRVIE